MKIIGQNGRRRIGAATLVVMLAGSLPASATVIVGAMVVDGTGAPRRDAAVRVERGRIVAIGRLEPRAGEPVIDGRGLVLAPGFIDTHSHHDIGLDTDRGATAAVAQGITTIVVGQDGTGAHPIATFFDTLRKRPAAVNVASYAGHNVIRKIAMGDGAARVATAQEQARMVAMLDRDMTAGALGLATGLEYDPGRNASPDEVLLLAKAAARHGGRYISHLRSEDRDLWAAVDEIIAIGRATRGPVQISHAKLAMSGLWGQAGTLLAKLDAARRSGIDITIDVYPYTYWQSQLALLWPNRDFTDRAQADYALRHLVRPDGLKLVSYPPDPGLAGLTLADIARRRGRDVTSVLIELAQADAVAGGQARVVAEAMAERDVAALMAWPHANICSDGLLSDAHPRGAGAFARVLRVYVRERRALTLEAAIHKMTGLAARHMGLRGRGTIRVGAPADLVLFDPATVADRATVENPAALAVGIRSVWVNGRQVWDGNRITRSFPGRVLRRGMAA